MSLRNQVVNDPTGFPMLWCEEVGAYVHWLPVTKIQFEYFLCAAPDAHFDAPWYDEILRLNPRISPCELGARNYWRALMTGLRPSEAQRFASWCGDDYRLPTEAEWSSIFHAARKVPPKNEPFAGMCEGASDRVQEILWRFDEVAPQIAQQMRCAPSLGSQMLLQFGTLEWVQTGSPPSAWSVKGEPAPGFCGDLSIPGLPAEPLIADPESCRFAAAGFRLIRFRSPEISGGAQAKNGSAAGSRGKEAES